MQGTMHIQVHVRIAGSHIQAAAHTEHDIAIH